MESTPLLLAHSHARNAAVETRKANPTAASEEHDLAAGEFANAAQSTGDTEALRTLKLLEQHHHRLAELLKFRPQDVQPTPLALPSPPLNKDLPQPASSTPKTLESSPRHISHHAPSPLQLPHRELSSSIASNLASARGIPSNRQRRGNQSPATLSPQTSDSKDSKQPRKSRLREQATDSADPRDQSSQSLVRPPALSPSRASVAPPDLTPTSPTRQIAPAPPDDSFSKFYTTFESLLSKLSAPLAFAGLPLNPTPEPNPPAAAAALTTRPQPASQPPDRAPLDPTITRLFSKAALRAIREEHGLHAAAESFYVVPTTGGTMTYAGMLSHNRSSSDASRLTAVDEDEEFVDARETPSQAPGSPTQTRKSRPIKRGAKTMEELAVENETLKAVAIDLGDRLRAFEIGAQRSSMALHMSMRAMQSPTASAAGVGGKSGAAVGGSAEGLEGRVRQLEEEVGRALKEVKRLGRENAKLQGVVERYRERWEILKVGARERIRDEGKEGGKG